MRAQVMFRIAVALAAAAIFMAAGSWRGPSADASESPPPVAAHGAYYP
jgi:hypothetical protein